MKLASFSHGGRTGFGAVIDDRVVPISDGYDGQGLCEFLSQSAPAMASATASGGAPILLREVQLLPPLAGKGRDFWVGANYRTLVSNRDGSSPGGKYPSLFKRTAESMVGHGAAIVRPRLSEQLDYEGEIVVVIGKPGRHISEADAHSHIAGFTIANDGCLRDYMDHGRNVTAGKNFDASAAMGPWIVTCDEIDAAGEITIETRVNGELRQRDSTANMWFSFASLIAYISGFAELLPGDMISTGSPMGAGGGPYGFDPPRWLVPGDVLEIHVPGIGTLSNHVVDEDQP